MTRADADAALQRLQRLLGGPALAALRARLRQRYAPLPRAVTPPPLRLGQLTPAEHAALAGLLGRPARFAASMKVDLAEADAALQRAGLAAGLRDALERLDGPIVDRTGDRVRREARWAALAGGCEHPALTALLGHPPGLGLFKRLARDPDTAAALLQQAAAVLQRLPAAGVPRAQLAAQVLGDAHALDRGAPVATLVLAALRVGRGLPLPEEVASGAPRIAAGGGDAARVDPIDSVEAAEAAEAALVASAETGDRAAAGSVASAPDDEPAAERDRDRWAAAGVLVNELARPVLALNLKLAGGGTLLPGEPTYLSLRQLLRDPPAWGAVGRAVFVCENPNLVAIAADRLGAASAPLVCTDGMPAAAQRVLLQQLAGAGATLHYHGDFDWPGLRIANQVIALCGAARWRAWRFSAQDYRAACESATGRPLAGAAAGAAWDAGLADAMQALQLAVDEEELADVLIADLADLADAEGAPGRR